MPDPELHYTADWSETHTLEDGTVLRLRLLRPTDRAAFLEAFERLSPESRYRRFFSAMPRLPENVLDGLLNTDGWNHLAIVAFDAADGRGVGVGRFIRVPGNPAVAEAAVAVVDSMQGRGIGKLLLGEVAEAARERGVEKFQAQVLTDNEAMVGLLHELDAKAVATVDGPVATYELDLPERTTEGWTGPLFDLLRAAGRGLDVLLANLKSYPPF